MNQIYSIAQVSRGAPPVSITSLLVSSLTGDQAIAEAVPALIVRVENIYESGGDYFAVDAKVEQTNRGTLEQGKAGRGSTQIKTFFFETSMFLNRFWPFGVLRLSNPSRAYLFTPGEKCGVPGSSREDKLHTEIVCV